MYIQKCATLANEYKYRELCVCWERITKATCPYENTVVRWWTIVGFLSLTILFRFQCFLKGH